MRCPSCGAVSKKRSMKCPECGAFRTKTEVDTESGHSTISDDILETSTLTKRSKKKPSQTPSLIEFPGVTRHAIPEWRKELGERVREVQERRAREATLEGGEEVTAPFPDEGKSGRALELLAKPVQPPTNPLVIAALRRIERAHARAQFSGNAAVATAVYDEQPLFDLETAQPNGEMMPMLEEEPLAIEETPDLVPEKTHNLSVVAAPPIIVPEEIVTDVEAHDLPEDETRATVKPKRLIRENDPALNYLDSVPTTIVDLDQRLSAPVFRRVVSSILDLLIIGLLAAPVAWIVKLAELHWRDPRVIGFAAGTVVVITFLYLTVNTALAGRTIAMRLFSLRVVDDRNGLIPTGTQSAGRAFFYLLSLATAGVGLMFVFVDRDGRTAHDRFTRTAVVRV